MTKQPPITLVILDGWGFSSELKGNAIAAAHPTTFETLLKTFPHTTLEASGRAVGLPEGYQGNSEVGHLTMGAGRIILQPLTLINDAIDDTSFFSHEQLRSFLRTLTERQGRLHLIGLVSDGGVHSHEQHLYALIKAAAEQHVQQLFVHAISDGRDTPPQSAALFIERTCTIMDQYQLGSLASITGRFYAMDRDENWERTLAFFDLLTTEKHHSADCWQHVLTDAYQDNLSDEYIPPTLLNPQGIVRPDDAIIFFNFRPDRMRQICSLFLNRTILAQKAVCPVVKQSPLSVTSLMSMTRYHHDFTNPVMFTLPDVVPTLMDILDEHQKRILTAAESEKYAHVTYFFSGGRETTRIHEKRILVPSPHVRSYAETPRMSAQLITEQVLAACEKRTYDFCLINYANADMVGHTGNFNAAIEAVLCIDEQLQRLVTTLVYQKEGILIITGDHGNAEEMIDHVTGLPKTSHTTHQVPCIVVFPPSRRSLWDSSNSYAYLNNLHGLADIAPLILSLMKLPVPLCMKREH